MTTLEDAVFKTKEFISKMKGLDVKGAVPLLLIFR